MNTQDKTALILNSFDKTLDNLNQKMDDIHTKYEAKRAAARENTLTVEESQLLALMNTVQEEEPTLDPKSEVTQLLAVAEWLAQYKGHIIREYGTSDYMNVIRSLDVMRDNLIRDIGIIVRHQKGFSK